MSPTVDVPDVPELILDLSTQTVSIDQNPLSLTIEVPDRPEVILGLPGPTGPPGDTGEAGFPMTFGPAGVGNVPATGTHPLGLLTPTTTAAFSVALSGTFEIKMDAPGKIVAAGIMTNAAVTGGTAALRARKNGVSVGVPICTLSPTNSRAIAGKTSDLDMVFVAGDTIGIALDTSGFAPTTLEVSGWFSVVFD